jgi:hypothetical protein
MAVASPKKPKSETATFTEYVSSRDSGVTIDREQGLIRGVRILGIESRNRRQYPAAIIKEAIALYEGCPVHISHPTGNPKATRPYQDRIGNIEGCEQTPDGGLKGNIRYNPKHIMAEAVIWDAEKGTDNVGLSHVADCAYRVVNGVEVIHKINKVYGCDIVCSPATNKSFKESTEDETMDFSTITLEQLSQARPDLIQAVMTEQAQTEQAKTQAAEIKTMLEELATLKAEKAVVAKRENIIKLATEAKLAKEYISDVFVESCLGCADDAAIKKVIDDRKSLVGAIKQTKAVSRDVGTAGTDKISFYK